MSFQSTVSLQQGFGVPGELFTDGPYIALPYTIYTASHPEYNIILKDSYKLGILVLLFAGILANHNTIESFINEYKNLLPMDITKDE